MVTSSQCEIVPLFTLILYDVIINSKRDNLIAGNEERVSFTSVPEKSVPFCLTGPVQER